MLTFNFVRKIRSFLRSDFVFFRVGVYFLPERFCLFLFQMIQIFMCFKIALAEIDHSDGNIGAVVGYPFQIGQDIIEDKALQDGTGTFLHTFHVMHLHFITEAIDDLFQRLNFLGALHILCDIS